MLKVKAHLYLGKNVSYTHNEVNYTSWKYAKTIDQNTLTHTNRNVVCYTWAALYKQALITIGFDESDIEIIKYRPETDSHNYIMFRINDDYYSKWQ